MLCGLSPHRPRNEISCVAFSADGKRLAFGSEDTNVYVWSENVNLVLRYGCPIFYVAFSSDGNMLAAGSYETLYISSVESGMLLHSLPFQCGDANHASVAFSSDNRQLAAASNVSMSVWNVATSDVASAFTLPYAFSLPYISMATFRAKSNVFFDVDGVATVILLLDNGAVHALSEASQQHLCILSNVFPLLNWNAGSDIQYWSGAFSPHTGLIVLGTSNGEIHVYDTTSGNLRYKKNQQQPVFKLVFSGNGKLFASHNTMSFIRIWHVETGALVKTFNAHPWRITSMCFSSDGKTLACGLNNTLKTMTYRVGAWLLLDYAILTKASLYLHAGAAPYVALDIANFLCPVKNSFFARDIFMHGEKIAFLAERMKKLR